MKLISEIIGIIVVLAGVLTFSMKKSEIVIELLDEKKVLFYSIGGLLILLGFLFFLNLMSQKVIVALTIIALGMCFLFYSLFGRNGKGGHP